MKKSDIRKIFEIRDKAFEDIAKVSSKAKAFLEQGEEFRARNQIKKMMRTDENFSRSIHKLETIILKTPEECDLSLKSYEEKFLTEKNADIYDFDREKSREFIKKVNKLKPNVSYLSKFFNVLTWVEYKHCMALQRKQKGIVFLGMQGASLLEIDNLPKGYTLFFDEIDNLLKSREGIPLIPRIHREKDSKGNNSVQYDFHYLTEIDGVSKGFKVGSFCKI